MRVVNTKGTPAAGPIGAYEFSGSSASQNQITMASIIGNVKDITGAGTGSMELGVSIAGIVTNFLTLNVGAGVEQVDVLRDLDVNTFDVLQIDRATFAVDSGAPLGVDTPQIYVTNSLGEFGLNSMVFNAQSGNGFIWTLSNVIAMQAAATVLQKEGENAIQFIRVLNRLNPITTGPLGGFEISGLAADSVGSGFTMAVFSGDIESTVNSGIGSAAIAVKTSSTGTPQNFVTFNAGQDGFVRFVQNTYLNNGYAQMDAIASPGTTGSATIGRVFMDSANSNHLSIIRDGAIVDLETSGGATSLDDLTDVTITGPVGPNQILSFDSGSSQWVNQSNLIINQITITNIGAGPDVVLNSNSATEDLDFNGANLVNGNIDTSLITSGILGITRGGTGNGANTRGDILYAPADNTWSRLPVGAANSFLRSDATDVAWSTIDLDTLSDVIITAPAANQVLTFNGSAWINQAPSGGVSFPIRYPREDVTIITGNATLDGDGNTGNAKYVLLTSDVNIIIDNALPTGIAQEIILTLQQDGTGEDKSLEQAPVKLSIYLPCRHYSTQEQMKLPFIE
jgi:hypothetical protein